MEIEKTLVELGLSRSEARIYLELLESEELTATSLASRLKMHRRLVYDYLDRMARKGFVSSIQKKFKTFFSAAHPAKLNDILRERKERLSELEAALSANIPQLVKRFEMKKKPLSVRLFFGKEGMKALFSEILRTRENLFWLSATFEVIQLLGNWFDWYDEERRKQGIKVKSIAIDTPLIRKRAQRFGQENVKFFGKEYLGPVVTGIFGDKLCFILWKEEPQIVLIESSEFASVYKKYFDLLWRSVGK